MRGYIVGLQITHSSGLALVQIADEPKGRVNYTKYIESGFGVRQLVDVFGSWEQMVAEAPVTELELRMDDSGMVITMIGRDE